jgi:hypothetical protein
MLAPFKIRPRAIWPQRAGTGEKPVKGYKRQWFEKARAAYCGGDGRPADSNNIRYLHRE